MASPQTRLLRFALRAVVKRTLEKRYATQGAYIAAMRATFERGESRSRAVAPDTRIVAIEEGDVRGEWVMRRDVGYGKRALLYVHGGGFVAMSAAGYRPIASALARRLGVPVFSVDYRLAPEHPFPAALDDTIAAYLALRARIPAEGIVIAGDSAGGNLALATVLALRERLGIPRPVAGIVAISPWTDLLATGASISVNARSDDTLPRVAPHLDHARAYAPQARFREPLISPLYGSYRDGPPMLVFASRTETLLDDARALVARVRSQGGIATLVTEDGLPHAWPIYPFLPEAKATYRTIADFAKRCWSHV